jgi:hypothetical protein
MPVLADTLDEVSEPSRAAAEQHSLGQNGNKEIMAAIKVNAKVINKRILRSAVDLRSSAKITAYRRRIVQQLRCPYTTS